MSKKSRSSLSQLRAAEHPMQWVKKQRTGLLHRYPFEKESTSTKAKGTQSRSAGFARDFGSVVAGTKRSGPYFDFAFLWLCLTIISSRRMPVQEPCFLFLHPLHRVFSCPLRQTLSGFFWQAFCPSLPVSRLSHTRNRRFASEIPLSTLVAVDRLTSFRSVRRRYAKALRKQPMRGIKSSGSKRTSLREPLAAPPFRLLSTGPCLHCVTVHCLASSQISVTSRKGTTSFPSTETERAVQGSPHNACIP